MTLPIVKRYFLAVGRHGWAIPAGLVLGVAASGFVAAQPNPVPVFKAGAVLSANRPPTVFSETGLEVRQSIDSFTPDSLLTDDVLKGTAEAVSIDVKELAKNTKVEVVTPAKGAKKPVKEDAAQVTVDYQDTDVDRMRKVMEELVKRMIDQSRLNNSARLRSVIQSLNQRLPQVKGELQEAEQRLEAYDRIEGPALLAAQNGSLISAITGSQQQARGTQLQLESVTVQIRSLEQRLGLDPDQAYVASALSADPIVANLRAQIQQVESQIALKSKDLQPEHPDMVALRKQQQTLEEQLQKRAGEVMGGNGLAAPFSTNVRQDSSLDPARQQLANTLVALKTQQDTLRQQLSSTVRSEQELRQAYANVPNKQLERTRLEQQVLLKKGLHDKMQAKLMDARAAEAETVSSLSLTKLGAAPTAPKSTKSVPIILLVGGVIGLLAGAGAVFLLDALEGKFYTAEDLVEALKQRDVNVLGVLPLVQSFETPPLPVISQPDSPYLETYERFRSKLRLAEGLSLRVVMLTSTIAQEGKSVTAYNLAIASARAGKRTLLIEGDLRSASNAHYLSAKPDPDSLFEPLRYYGQLSDCVRLVPDVENLYIVPSPGPQRQAASILESSEMRRLLEDARGRFDFVVLDTPSLSRCNDALLLERYTDGMVLVTRPGVTQSSLLAEAIDHLNETEEARLLGAVVTGSEMPVAPREVSPPFIPPDRETLADRSEPNAAIPPVSTGNRS
jgi:capsular exopolysaccharide synthesis family protein